MTTLKINISVMVMVGLKIGPERDVETAFLTLDNRKNAPLYFLMITINVHFWQIWPHKDILFKTFFFPFLIPILPQLHVNENTFC